MEPRENQIVADRYRLERCIGRGGMGEVWAATCDDLGAVALKFILPKQILTRTLRERVFREARAAGAVRHPNVIEIHDAFTVGDGVPVIVMELLEGETLAERLRLEGRLPLPRAVDIMLQVVSAVGAAHARGVVHRDLKPENIFLQSGGRPVKVLDFGVAKIAQPAGAVSLTGTGQLLGTPAYMAPEQCCGASGIDHRADVWAIGIILYEVLGGERPLRGNTAGRIMEQLLTEGVLPLRAFAPDAPFDISIVARKMLERDPAARPPDLRPVAEVLAHHTALITPPFGPPGSERPDDDEISEPVSLAPPHEGP